MHSSISDYARSGFRKTGEILTRTKEKRNAPNSFVSTHLRSALVATTTLLGDKRNL